MMKGLPLFLIELVSDDLTFFCPKNFQTSKLNQSTRVVKIVVDYTIRPFKRTPGTKVDRKSLEVWEFSVKLVSSHPRPALQAEGSAFTQRTTKGFL